jgi:riboflavin synthase
MFSGIIETSLPILEAAERAGGGRRLSVGRHWPDVSMGQSIALNGCCLTVADLSAERIGFDLIPETLSRTNLGRLRVGDRVHVERSLRVGDRIDGHFVQGHIDGTAALIGRKGNAGEVRLEIRPPAELAEYIVPKGSVCVDGVSLTVAGVGSGSFEVALIPTTLAITQLGRREIGWPFNLETDILNKTIVSWLQRQRRRAEDKSGA